MSTFLFLKLFVLLIFIHPNLRCAIKTRHLGGFIFIISLDDVARTVQMTFHASPMLKQTVIQQNQNLTLSLCSRFCSFGIALVVALLISPAFTDFQFCCRVRVTLLYFYIQLFILWFYSGFADIKQREMLTRQY